MVFSNLCPVHVQTGILLAAPHHIFQWSSGELYTKHQSKHAKNKEVLYWLADSPCWFPSCFWPCNKKLVEGLMTGRIFWKGRILLFFICGKKALSLICLVRSYRDSLIWMGMIGRVLRKNIEQDIGNFYAKQMKALTKVLQNYNVEMMKNQLYDID